MAKKKRFLAEALRPNPHLQSYNHSFKTQESGSDGALGLQSAAVIFSSEESHLTKWHIHEIAP